VSAAGTVLDRRPFFHEHGGRSLYFLHFPAPGGAARGGAVFFAPFAEEMNRSRRMATLLGEALAARGLETLVFDCSGTGDSAGEFAAARWDDWESEGAAAANWLAGRIGGKVTAVGLRTGAALALAAARAPEAPVARLVLWQPVASGQVFLTQLLRLRLAAALGDATRGETTKALRERLAAGETIEIAGYDLAPAMADALDAIRLADVPPPEGCPAAWLEVAAAGGATSPAGRAVLERWRGAGAAVAEAVVEGPQFWAIQETTTAPALIEATVRLIADATP